MPTIAIKIMIDAPPARVFDLARDIGVHCRTAAHTKERAVDGAFKSMRHVHEFEASGDGTLMTDTMTWTSPLGILGAIADKLVLERHMREFVERRNVVFKEIAETPSDSEPATHESRRG